MTKFTPGPWLVGTKNGGRIWADFGKILIAETDKSDWINKQEMKENAKLIAAAPDMYAALKQCHEAMAYMSEYDIPLTLPEQVKTALEKAKGEIL